jgi:CheY-like chemotaxis protein
MNFTVLLIEPDPSNVPEVRSALSGGAMRSEMRWVTNGEHAIRYLRREDGFHESPRPDAILLTWNLPNDDASRLKGTLESDPALARIPVITLSPENADAASRDKHACRTRSRTAIGRPHRHHSDPAHNAQKVA